MVERPGGSELKRAIERGTDEEISEGEEKEDVSVRDEDEKVSFSEKGTEAESAEEADDGENDGRESGDPAVISVGPHDISKCKGDAAVQPSLKTFPKTLHGAAKRSFHSEWYNSWPWLEYSPSRDAAYCFACRHFAISKTSVFTSENGYTNWKKATSKDSGFSVHAKSDIHVNAMIAWSEYKSMARKDTSVFRMMGDENKKQVIENQNYIKTLGEILLLTATQNISQRGHDETETSKNGGNFLEISGLMSEHDALVKRRLSQGPRNAKYTSKSTQNEILECLAEMVRGEIVKEIKESEHFSILADETKDIKKKEQMSLVVRYYYDGVVQESFLEYQKAEHLDAASLTEKIISCLEKYGLEYKENLVGQGYDGAAVMSGRCSGVQTRVKEVAKYAFYVHCSAHCLNLVIVDCVKNVQEAACFFTLLERLYTFLSGSYVHNKWIDVQKEMFSGAPRELPKLSDTRWACRYAACRNLMDRVTAVMRVLDEISDETNPQRAVEARGLRSQIDFNFMGLLVVFRKVLGETKILSEMLQSTNVDLTKAADLTEALRQTFEEYRKEESFNELWSTVIETCNNCNISTIVQSKRTKQMSSRLCDSLVTSTLGQQTHVVSKDAFRIGIFLPIIDSMIGEMDRRFSNSSCKIMRGIQALNPSNNDFLKEELVLLVAEAYGSDLQDLKIEICQARLLERNKTNGKVSPSSLIEFVTFLAPYKEVFFELFRLCKIAIVLPVSTAGFERSFSTLKLVKNHLRSTMADDRLRNLAVLSIEKQRAKKLDLNMFVRRFAPQHNNHRLKLS